MYFSSSVFSSDQNLREGKETFGSVSSFGKGFFFLGRNFPLSTFLLGSNEESRNNETRYLRFFLILMLALGNHKE